MKFVSSTRYPRRRSASSTRRSCARTQCPSKKAQPRESAGERADGRHRTPHRFGQVPLQVGQLAATGGEDRARGHRSLRDQRGDVRTAPPGRPGVDARGARPRPVVPTRRPGVHIEGAEPGDALEVEILTLQPGSWGWAALLPGLGLLAAVFPDPYVRYFELGHRKSAELRHDIHIPIAPFCGTMGVATDEPGKHDVLPPPKGGGNIDTRHLTAGTT